MRHVSVSPRTRSRMPYEGEDVRVRSRGGVPVGVEWRHRELRVLSVEASWCIDGRWWLDQNRCGVRRRYFRVCVQSPSGHTLCLELFRTRRSDTPNTEWRLWRIAD